MALLKAEHDGGKCSCGVLCMPVAKHIWNVQKGPFVVNSEGQLGRSGDGHSSGPLGQQAVGQGSAAAAEEMTQPLRLGQWLALNRPACCKRLMTRCTTNAVSAGPAQQHLGWWGWRHGASGMDRVPASILSMLPMQLVKKAEAPADASRGEQGAARLQGRVQATTSARTGAPACPPACR